MTNVTVDMGLLVLFAVVSQHFSTSALSTGPGTHGIIIDYGLRYGDGDS